LTIRKEHPNDPNFMIGPGGEETLDGAIQREKDRLSEIEQELQELERKLTQEKNKQKKKEKPKSRAAIPKPTPEKKAVAEKEANDSLEELRRLREQDLEKKLEEVMGATPPSTLSFPLGPN